jgi:hypothetical protein
VKANHLKKRFGLVAGEGVQAFFLVAYPKSLWQWPAR